METHMLELLRSLCLTVKVKSIFSKQNFLAQINPINLGFAYACCSGRIEENTPVQKKVLKETHKTGSNTTITSGNINGTKRLNMLAPLISKHIFPRSNYNGEISSKAINKINEIISEMNAEGKM